MSNDFHVLSNALFSLAFLRLRIESPWPAMLAAALFTSIFVLLIVKVISNQKAVRRAKDKIVATCLEIILYEDDIVVSLLSFTRAVMAILAYGLKLLPTLLVCLVPIALIISLLASWFGARPLRPGESAILKLRLEPSSSAVDHPVSLVPSGNIVIESPALRIPENNEINWRFRAGEGQGQAEWIDITVNGAKMQKEVSVSTSFERAIKVSIRSGFWNALKNPGGATLPADGPADAIVITYPPCHFAVAGIQTSWFVVFLLLTFVFTEVLKRPMGVVL